jgi:hypothetical protein
MRKANWSERALFAHYNGNEQGRIPASQAISIRREKASPFVGFSNFAKHESQMRIRIARSGIRRAMGSL